jgi:hypothetical protein
MEIAAEVWSWVVLIARGCRVSLHFGDVGCIECLAHVDKRFAALYTDRFAKSEGDPFIVADDDSAYDTNR